MNYLLDVNILVAWGWEDHVEHERTVRWIAAASKRRDTTLLTSAIPQLGFVRVSVQRTPGRISVSEASEALADLLTSLGSRHAFLADNQASENFPDWCQSASRTTDAHLLQLAGHHNASLATLDTGIQGAFVIPTAL